MKEKSFVEKAKNHLSKYKEEELKILGKGKYNYKGKVIEGYRHILPDEREGDASYDKYETNFLRLAKEEYLCWGGKEVKLHHLAHHLNSSQAMCINFFGPLLRNKVGKALLISILEDADIIRLGKEKMLIEATFEKVLNSGEGTNFDFYLEFSSGERIMFEIKYTEDGFGKKMEKEINSEKYLTKWTYFSNESRVEGKKGYVKHLKNSLFNLDFIEKLKGREEFYKNYQIWRNVSYVEKPTDYLVFLFPFKNEKFKEEINITIGNKPQFEKNIKVIDWEKLVGIAQNNSEKINNGVYLEHFKEFYKKYLNF